MHPSLSPHAEDAPAAALQRRGVGHDSLGEQRLHQRAAARSGEPDVQEDLLQAALSLLERDVELSSAVKGAKISARRG